MASSIKRWRNSIHLADDSPRGSDGRRWAVIGGGLLGMTLAHRLAQRGHDVTLFERAKHLGGLASAWSLGDIVWDRHYHVTLLSDTHTRSLLAELGLEQEMRWVETKTGFYTDGELYSMSNALEFLRFPPLGLVSKARLAATILYASRIKNWRRLENIRVADWLQRWSGRRTFDRIWLPLLRSKLGESYQKTSAAFIWATIARMYAARRTGLKREMFGYVNGGYSRVLDVFHERLIGEGVRVELGGEVSQIASRTPNGVTVDLAEGKSESFDFVVVTLAPPIAARVCPGLNEEEQSRLETVEYQGIVCASALLKKPLAGYYVTNLTDDDLPFTAVIEMTALVDPAELGGHTLVYLPKYLASDDPAFLEDDKAWQDRFMKALLQMYPHVDSGDLLAFQVSRERYVYPLPTIAYSSRLSFQQTSIPALHIVNSAQIVNGTLNVNETVRLAESSLLQMLGEAS
ncbi:NAD(P)/FAD-dependent oxidoreductase [Acidobacteriota bacterium]